MAASTKVTGICAVLGGFLALAPGASGQSRPDLVDYDPPPRFLGALPGSRSGTNHMYVGAFGANGVGRVRMSGELLSSNANSAIHIHYTLYEPDKVTRKGDLVKLQQSGHVAVLVMGSTPGTFFAANSLLASCKAKVQVRGAQAKWQLSCGSDALSALGLNPDQQAAFAQLTGSTKLQVKGRTP